MGSFLPRSRGGRSLLAVVVLALIILGTCGYVLFTSTDPNPGTAWEAAVAVDAG